MLSKYIISTTLLGFLAVSSASILAAGTAVGTIDASFSVNPVTGAATYSIPIKVPAGIGGLQPNLTLNYNSQAGGGLLGIGWNLSGATSLITRCPKNYAQDVIKQGVNRDVALEKLCLDGQKLVNTAGAYGEAGTEYRTEIETDLYVRQYGQPVSISPPPSVTGLGPGQVRALISVMNPPVIFSALTKSGLTRTYAIAKDMNPSSGIIQPDSTGYRGTPPPSPPAIVGDNNPWLTSWGLSSTTDDFGNQILYNYLPNSEIQVTLPDGTSVSSDVFHPMAFDYSFLKNSKAPKLSVFIEYETRPDLKFVNVVGLVSAVNKRIKSITVYRTSWDQATYDTATTAKARATLYESATPIKRYALNYNENIVGDARSILTSVEECGFPDGTVANPRCLPKLIFKYSNPVVPLSWVEKITQITPSYSGQFSGSTTINYLPYQHLLSVISQNVKTGDFNGDGITDVFHIDRQTNGVVNDAIWQSTPGGGFTKTAGIPEVGFAEVSSTYAIMSERRKLGDFDGDGKTDILFVNGWGYTENYIWLSTKKDWVWVSQNVSLYIYRADVRNDTLIDLQRVVLADFNGDGLTDIYWKALPEPWAAELSPFPSKKDPDGNRTDNDRLYLSKGDGQFVEVMGLDFNAYDSNPDNTTKLSTITASQYGTTKNDQRLGRLSETIITKVKNRAINALTDITGMDSTGRIADADPAVLAGNIEQRITAFKYNAKNILSETQEQVVGDQGYLKTSYLYDYDDPTAIGSDSYGNKTSAEIAAVTGSTTHYGIAKRTATSLTDYSGLTNLGKEYTVTTNNELLHEQIDIIDIVWGITSSTGPNNLTTSWAYDEFGNKIKESRADGSETEWIYEWCDHVSHCPAQASYFVYEYSHLTGFPARFTDPPVTVYYDFLNRAIKSKTIGFNGDTLYSDTLYDKKGRAWRSSLPYFSGGAKLWTTTYFDEIDRVIRIENPDGSTVRTLYNQNDGLESSVIRENIGPDGFSVHASRVRKNVLGQTQWAEDELGNITWFTYTPFGDIKTITGPKSANNPITLYYDKRGRKTQIDDPDMGTWTYTYDGLGNLRYQTDAIGNMVEMEYDLLNRLIKKIDTADKNTTTTAPDDYEFHWCYDEINTATCAAAISTQVASMSVGKPVLSTKARLRSNTQAYSAANELYRETYTYDNLGRPETVATTIDNVLPEHITTTVYDATYPRVDRVVYPQVKGLSGAATNFIKVNRFKAYGYLEKIFDADTMGTALWSATLANEKNQIIEEKLANGVVTRRNFD